MHFKIRKIQLSKEIPSIGLLRGIAASMVCFFHLSFGDPLYLPKTSLVRTLGHWGWSGVEIFFVISGFIIPYSMYCKNYSLPDFFLFLKKRVIRIEPPFLISIALALLLNFLRTLSPDYHGHAFSIDYANLAGHLLYLNAFTGSPWIVSVYWTLAIEFQFYLLIALTYGLLVAKNGLWRILFFVCFAASSFLKLPQNTYVFSFALYFLAGMLLFQFVCGIISSREFWILISITIISLLFTSVWQIAGLIILTLLTIVYVNEVPAFLRYLGLISYSFYLIHGPVGLRIQNFSEAHVQNRFLKECIPFITYIMCIIASAIFYRCFEKPFKKYSDSIKYHSRVNTANSL